jgi:hypothetical protein
MTRMIELVLSGMLAKVEQKKKESAQIMCKNLV